MLEARPTVRRYQATKRDFRKWMEQELGIGVHVHKSEAMLNALWGKFLNSIEQDIDSRVYEHGVTQDDIVVFFDVGEYEYITTNHTSNNPQEKTVGSNTVINDDFATVSIAIPIAVAKAIKLEDDMSEHFGSAEELTDWLLAIIAEELPGFIDLEVGMRYGYPEGGHAYEIAQLGESTVQLRRLTNNRNGPKGSWFLEERKKIERDLVFGIATVINPEDTEESRVLVAALQPEIVE